VILKTDMTHLANRGERRERILAGLYDAVCANVQVLIKPRRCPNRVVLVGGVTRSKRVRDSFLRFLVRNDMALAPWNEDDALYFDALGCALAAAEQPSTPPPLPELIAQPEPGRLDPVPGLSLFLDRVQRMPPQRLAYPAAGGRGLVMGFDIGSTGAKAVALDATTRERLWQGYVATNGNPVRAAQQLMAGFTDTISARNLLLACAVTGSGREIVASLLSTCYGRDAVFVLNEIAAHAAGALFYDARVDTIFEIGGQDAKYIRLVDGRVIDAAMNEACSAGTGSFIEEQGQKLSDIHNVANLGKLALEAAEGLSLGQHCSVFMAEIIDEAVASRSRCIRGEPWRNRRRNLRLRRPKLSQSRQGQPLGGQRDLLPGHAVRG
jgi:activator of 2-hydroxyglutaryl-CoA dehydratase